MYISVNRISLILLFSFFSYAEENININRNIIIPVNSLVKSIKIQRDKYIENLMRHPFIDKEYYLVWEKIQVIKEKNILNQEKEDELLKMLKIALNKSIENNTKLNNYLKGLIHFILEDYNKAFPFFKKASRQGNKDALFLYALYFTPYLGNDVDIPKFYFLLKQSVIGKSTLPFISQIRWWKPRNIKPLLQANALINILETKSFITNKELKKIDEYIYTPINSQTLKNNNFDQIAQLTLLFKEVFFEQSRLTSLNKQVLSKDMNSSTLSSFLKSFFPKLNEAECTKMKPYLYTNNYQPENKCGKNLPFKQFIKKIKAGNPCLISNKKSHHFLLVYSIDYKTRKIYFIDGWVQNSFLLEKNNILGLKGKIIKLREGNLIELSFEDYEYSAIGCVSLNTL